jgi:hypothetical protein
MFSCWAHAVTLDKEMAVGQRFNPPPGWPRPPEGFVPPPGWQPDPSWPPAPPGWQLWVPDDSVPDQPGAAWPSSGAAAPPPAFPGQAGTGTSGQPGLGTPPPGPPGQYPGAPGQYQQYPGQPGYGPPFPGQPGPQRTNGFAIAALIFGIIGGVLLSVIFAIVALVKIRNNPQQRGKGLAIAGLVLSGLWVVLIVVVIAVAVLSTPQRSSTTGQITHKGTASVFSLRTGDCFQNPNSQAVVTTVTVVPCTQAHNAQVFAQFPATGGSSYPGLAALRAQAKQGCRSRVATNINRSLVTNSMTIQFLYPESDSWASGERAIRCLIVDSSADLTTSLMSSG